MLYTVPHEPAPPLPLSAAGARVSALELGEEDGWLRLPPLVYMKHAAADHHLSLYIEHMEASVQGIQGAELCGRRVSELGPTPAAERALTAELAKLEPVPDGSWGTFSAIADTAGNAADSSGLSRLWKGGEPESVPNLDEV